MRYVIVGTSAAGVSCISAIRKIDSEGEIVAISKEKYHPYTPVFLAEVLTGDMEERELFFKGEDFFKKMNAEPILGKEAVKIHTRKKVLELLDGERIDYDRLLIATGSRAFIPPVDGMDNEGVYPLHRLDNVRRMNERAEESESAVVIGAGPIGLEAAYALRKKGLAVTVVEMLDRILPLMLDRELSEMVMHEFTDKGIEFILGTPVSRVLGDGEVSGVMVGDRKIPADLVVVATGVRPNKEIAERSGIKTNVGIVVDRRMQTSAENVYSAGDVAEAEDAFGDVCLTPTWANAVSQGEVAGKNMAGESVTHEGSIRVNIMKGIGTPLVSLGHTSATLRDRKYQMVEFKSGMVYRRAFFDSDLLIGFQSVGSHKDVRLAGMLQAIIRKRIPVVDKESLVRKGNLFAKNIPEIMRSVKSEMLKV